MTAAQEAARNKAEELLKEHFDSFVLVIDTEASDNTDRLFDATWHGGLTTAIGLVERARSRLCNKAEVSDTTDNV